MLQTFLVLSQPSSIKSSLATLISSWCERVKYTAYKRLTKEYVSFQKNPPPYLMAKPLENNILEWHYVIRGPPDTPYHNGEYHGVLNFPPEYPYKPPAIRMTTPSGRFQPDARLCLSMSDFHPSTWNPGWSVATILTGLLSFMCGNEATTGSIKTTDADKKIYAARSHQYNINDPKFKEIFPELCLPEAVVVEILYPMNPSSTSKTISVNSPNDQTAKVATQFDFKDLNRLNPATTIQQREATQRLKNNRGENPPTSSNTLGNNAPNNPLNVHNNNNNIGARSSETVSVSGTNGAGGI
ncbi:hypothetical protein G9A89_015561 [Geosiphon pyriformis]|nr:hypothetical protein G9A89_015561 [Geosiphon pyriformis]